MTQKTESRKKAKVHHIERIKFIRELVLVLLYCAGVQRSCAQIPFLDSIEKKKRESSQKRSGSYIKKTEK
jgi:hypothetical protein